MPLTLTSISDFRVKGTFFNGKDSIGREAAIVFRNRSEMLLECGNDDVSVFRIEDVRMSGRVGNIPRIFEFPDGAKFETTDNDAVDEILLKTGTVKKRDMLHVLESSSRLILLLVISLAAFASFFYFIVLPFAVHRVSFMVPPFVLKQSSDQTLKILDETFFGPSTIEKITMEKTDRVFNDVVLSDDGGSGYSFRLLYRDGKQTGANAFSLPDGTVIVTDELIDLAENNSELFAVFAHEKGHIVKRHGVQMVIRNSVASAFIIFITSDIVSYSSIAAALPAMLIENGYSRKFEKEADMYALGLLSETGRDFSGFESILKKLYSDSPRQKGTGLMSTHPGLNDRLELAGEFSSAGGK